MTGIRKYPKINRVVTAKHKMLKVYETEIIKKNDWFDIQFLKGKMTSTIKKP